MRAGVKVYAPASVANVACGFDVLGFALEAPGDDIIVRPGKSSGLKIVKITGDQGKLPKQIEKNTAGVAAQRLMEHLGAQDESIEMEIHKKMPFGSGLGSSAASAAGAVVAVNEILGRPLTRRELLPFAVLGEQVADGAYHADNVAPSLLGGLILIRDNQELDFYRIPVPIGLKVLLVYPHIEILTKAARDIISPVVTLENMVKQSGNLAGLITGFFTSNFELIQNSLNDHIIEPQRAKLIPHFSKMKDLLLESGALGCSISGAGPSIFALYNNSSNINHAGLSVQKMLRENNVGSDVYISNINMAGTIKY